MIITQIEKCEEQNPKLVEQIGDTINLNFKNIEQFKNCMCRGEVQIQHGKYFISCSSEGCDNIDITIVNEETFQIEMPETLDEVFERLTEIGIDINQITEIQKCLFKRS